MQTADEIRQQISEVEGREFHAGAKWYQEKQLAGLRERLRLLERSPEERMADLRKQEAVLAGQLRVNHDRIERSPVRLGAESALQRQRAKFLSDLQAVRAEIAALAPTNPDGTPAEEPEPIAEPLHRARRGARHGYRPNEP